MTDPTGSKGDDIASETDPADVPESQKRTPKFWLKVGGRIVITVGALVLSAFVLANVFDDLDPQAIGDSFRSLTDAEWLALGLGWMAMITAQGFQTAALVPKLPVRQGIQAYLGPAAVSSVIPGPSDLPVRYSMFMSWGRSATEAGTAVGANGIFSIGSKLILPAIAGLAIVIGDIPWKDSLRSS